jgi:hypothetical protein
MPSGKPGRATLPTRGCSTPFRSEVPLILPGNSVHRGLGVDPPSRFNNLTWRILFIARCAEFYSDR